MCTLMVGKEYTFAVTESVSMKTWIKICEIFVSVIVLFVTVFIAFSVEVINTVIYL